MNGYTELMERLAKKKLRQSIKKKHKFLATHDFSFSIDKETDDINVTITDKEQENINDV